MSKFRPLVATAVAFSVPLTPVIQAQTLKLEEVVVTAQRTEQSLQDVPISMNVVSAADMSRNSILSFAETAQLTPGVTLNSVNPALASIKVRGVGPSFFASGASQSVTIFVDEIAASQPGAVFSTMVDIERIEVLKGPQGTLYGRNAPSGAYNITTAAPSFDGVSGSIDGNISRWDNTGEPTIDVRGAVNLPIVDEKVALRVAAVYADSDGGFKMGSPLAQSDTTGGKEHKSVRGRLLVQLTDYSELNVLATYQELDDTYGFAQYEGLVPATGGSNPVPAIYNDFDDLTDFSARSSFNVTEVKSLGLMYHWDGDLTSIDTILDYQEFDTRLFQNQNPYPTLTPGSVDVLLDTRQTSFELRASNSGELFDYVAGLYLIRREGGSLSLIDLGGLFVPNDVYLDGGGEAVFGNVTFHVNESWDIVTGMRYEVYSFDHESDAEVAGFEGLASDELEFDHLSWSFKLKYFPSENTMAYLAIDNSYRQGGLNSYMPAIIAIGNVLRSQDILDTGAAFLKTDKEVSTSFELGLKGSGLDNRLQYNLAVFYQEFEDHIMTLPQPNAPGILVVAPLYTLNQTNVDEVVSQGVEFDLNYLLSEHWSVAFRAAYSDATIEKWEDKPCSFQFNDPVGDVFCPAVSGQDLTNLPKWNTNLQLGYDQPLAADWEFFSNLSWTWNAESDGEGVTQEFNDSLNYLNLTLGVSNDEFQAKLWGKNLTKQNATQLPYIQENGVPGLPGALTGVFTPGREYGVSLGYSF